MSALIGLLAEASCVTIEWMVRAGVLVLAFAGTAAAQPNEPEPPNAGAKLFEEGRELAKAGNYADACAKFEQSYALDNGVGTELNLADCKERLGHYSFAFSLFDDAAKRSTDNPQRAKFARDRADALTGKVATIVVNAAPDGSTVMIGGHLVKSAPVITEKVDPGTVSVHVESAGKATLLDEQKQIVAGATITVDVPATTVVAHGEIAGPDHRRRNRLIAAYSVGGVGVATLGVGIVVGIIADHHYKDALAMCEAFNGGTACPPGPQASAISAGSLADKATVVSIVGGVAIAAGVVLYVTAPKDLVVAPMASNQTAGLAISGRF